MKILAFLKDKLPDWIQNMVILAIGFWLLSTLVIKPQNELILAAIQKDTYKIENTFEKIKTTKNGQVIIKLDNKLFAMTPITPQDTISQPEKKGLFKKIFGKK